MDRNPLKFVTHVSYSIRDDSKRMAEISAFLGVLPTWAFDKGDTYEGKERVDGVARPVIRTHPFGVWHYSSEGLVQGDDIDDHLAFVLAALEPAADRIALLMQNPEVKPGAYLWHVGDLGFTVYSSPLVRLAKITSWVSVSCWPDEDEDDDSDSGSSEDGQTTIG
jgi:hypothetical protein